MVRRRGKNVFSGGVILLLLLLAMPFIYFLIQAILPKLSTTQPYVEEVTLEVKAIIVYYNGKAVEVVSPIWINGAKDIANRPFKFVKGSKVTLTAPQYLYGAEFAFWQKEEGQTYQGLIITNRTITITLDQPKTIWWINYRY
jgi:hypothetical protein